jgi:hypothetical protein
MARRTLAVAEGIAALEGATDETSGPLRRPSL